MNEIIRKARTKYDMLFTSIITFIGITTCVIATSGVTIIMGVTFIIAGMVCWFMFKSGYIDTVSKQNLTKTEVYYAIEHKQGIIDAVLNDPKRLSQYPKCSMNTIKLDIYYNNEDAYVQMYEYIPCSYKPCTKLIKHKAGDVSNVIH